MFKTQQKNNFKKRIATLIISSLIILMFFSVLIQVQFAQTNTLTIESITPASGLQGANIEVIIAGIGFTEETRVFLRRGTFTINPAQTYYEQNNNASLNLRINFDIPINPDLVGPYNVTVRNPNGGEFTLIDGFIVLGEGINLENLTVTNVNPSVVERGQQVWIELEGSGFIFVEDGSQIDPNWRIGKPFFTIVIPPDRISSYSFGQLDWLNVINSHRMQFKIAIDPTVPPQSLRFILFNPRVDETLEGSIDMNELWENQNNPNQITSFYIEVIEGQDETDPTSNSSCIIATAAYGSEVEPEVQFLRDFRDSKVLSTYSGSNFMQAFNAFYYSWSPSVANVIRENDLLRGLTRGLITPLLGTLFVSWNVFELLQFSPELAIIIAGFVAGVLLGAIYIGIPLTIASKLSRRLSEKLKDNKIIIILLLSVGLGFVLTALGLIIGSTIFSIVGSALLILSSMTLSANLTARILFIIGRKVQKFSFVIVEKIATKIENHEKPV